MSAWRNFRDTAGRYFRELGKYFTAMATDLARSKFWRGAILCLIPAIIAAMAISLNVPRLILDANTQAPRYIRLDENSPERAEFEAALKAAIQKRLEDKLNLFSSREDAEAPTPDYLAGDEFLCVEIPTILKVTNNGTLNTTITSASIYVIEEIDGKRIARDFRLLPNIDKNIPQGGTIELILESEGKIVLFDTGRLLLLYDVVRLVCKAVEQRFPKEHEWLPLAETYLRMLGGSPAISAKMRRLTDENIRSRVLLIIEIRDVYNRVGRAEVTLVDSVEWTVRQRQDFR